VPAPASGDATLPESGGVVFLPAGLMGLGAAALATGFVLRGRSHGGGRA